MNKNPKSIEYCEKILWPAYIRYLNRIANLGVSIDGLFSSPVCQEDVDIIASTIVQSLGEKCLHFQCIDSLSIPDAYKNVEEEEEEEYCDECGCEECECEEIEWEVVEYCEDCGCEECECEEDDY